MFKKKCSRNNDKQKCTKKKCSRKSAQKLVVKNIIKNKCSTKRFGKSVQQKVFKKGLPNLTTLCKWRSNGRIWRSNP